MKLGFAGFQGTNPEAKIGLQPVRFRRWRADLPDRCHRLGAGSDKALADDEVEQSKSVCTEGTAFDVPVYISPIAVVFNLKGVSDAGKQINTYAAIIAKLRRQDDRSGTIRPSPIRTRT